MNWDERLRQQVRRGFVNYHVVVLDLTTARENISLPVSGEMLFVSVLTGTVSIRLNKTSNDLIALALYRKLNTVFTSLFITNTAQAGKMLELMVGTDFDIGDVITKNDTVPAGMMMAWPGTIAAIPAGWLFCDGRSLLRLDYPALFAAIGTAWGAVDASHFNLPDSRDIFPVGARQDDAGVAKTNISGSLTQTGGNISHGHNLGPNDQVAAGADYDSYTSTVQHLPPYAAFPFIIKT